MLKTTLWKICAILPKGLTVPYFTQSCTLLLTLSLNPVKKILTFWKYMWNSYIWILFTCTLVNSSLFYLLYDSSFIACVHLPSKRWPFFNKTQFKLPTYQSLRLTIKTLIIWSLKLWLIYYVTIAAISFIWFTHNSFHQIFPRKKM